MKTFSLLKYLFVFISLCSLFIPNRLLGQLPWRTKEREITRLIDKNKDCEENMKAYYAKNKELVNKIKTLELEIERYMQDQGGVPIVADIPNDDDREKDNAHGGKWQEESSSTSSSSKPGSAGLPNYQPELEKLRSRLEENERIMARLNNNLNLVNQKIGSLESDNERLASEIEALKIDIEERKVEIERLSVELDKVTQELKGLSALVACIETFQSGRLEKKQAARQEIAKANLAYERYWKYYNRQSKSDRDSYAKGQMLLEEAWQIYSNYGAANCDSMFCRDPLNDRSLLMSYCDDYLGGYENYLIARIAAFEPHIIANSMPDDMSLGAKLNKLNETLLLRIGQALSKGVYDDKSATQSLVDELSDIMERIPNLIVQERKGSVNTETKGYIQNITKAYNQANYAVSINIYNQYERFFNLDELNEEGYRRDMLSAKYCAGTILLWDLGEVSHNKGLVSYNSWLGSKLNTRRQSGRNLLLELIRDLESSEITTGGWEEALLRKTYIALKKEFTISP